MDPWLAEKILREKGQRLRFEEENYQRAMSGFFDELHKMDAFLSESIQSVISVYSACISFDSSEMQSINQRMAKAAEDLQPIQEFKEFLSKTGLVNREVWGKEVKPIAYRFQGGPLAKIFKQGVLSRRVGTITFAWKESTLASSPPHSRPFPQTLLFHMNF